MSPRSTTIDEVLEVVQSHGRQIFEVSGAVHEVAEAVHLLATQMEVRFGQVNERFGRIDQKFESMDQRFESMDQRIEMMDSRVTKIASQMVTKHYLDDKLADLRGDLTLLTRRADQKLLSLVDLLFGKRLMTKEERQHIMALQPFAAT